MMKRSSLTYAPMNREIVFMPALTPLEAAVLPAKERRSIGALRYVKDSFRLGEAADRMRLTYFSAYRQKI